MRILLTAATPFEIQPTVDWLLSLEPDREENRLVFPSCKIEVCFTGIGPVRTAFALGMTLRGQDPPALAIQAGIAGAFDEALKLGQVVTVRSDRFLDDGAEDRDGSLLDLADMGFPYAAPFDESGILKASVTNTVLPFQEVVGGTVSRATGTANSIDLIRSKYPDVQTESMEGAAFLYACLSTGVQALQLRSISNYVGPRDRSTWQMKPALENLNRDLRQVIQPFIGFS